MMTFSKGTIAQIKLVRDSATYINDMGYGYTINNIQSKDDYERYEIRFFVTNTGCAKYIPARANLSFNMKAPNIIADFSCINATGKRLTNKGKSIGARDWNFSVNETMSKELAGKTIQLGYVIAKGETIGGTEIILTPKGELPIIQVSPIPIREINN
jgi:hypothetical protein